MIDAAPETVFDAFVAPEAQKELYSDGPDWVVESACDLRIGGEWTITFGQAGNTPAREVNVFEDVDRPRRLAFRSAMHMPGGELIETHITVTFEPHEGKTRMRVVQAGFPTAEQRDGFDSGWSSILASLGRVVA